MHNQAIFMAEHHVRNEEFLSFTPKEWKHNCRLQDIGQKLWATWKKWAATLLSVPKVNVQIFHEIINLDNEVTNHEGINALHHTMWLLFCLIIDWSPELAKQMVCSPQFFWGGGAVCHLINRLWSIGRSTWSEKSAPSLCTAAFSSFLLSANTVFFPFLTI